MIRHYLCVTRADVFVTSGDSSRLLRLIPVVCILQGAAVAGGANGPTRTDWPSRPFVKLLLRCTEDYGQTEVPELAANGPWAGDEKTPGILQARLVCGTQFQCEGGCCAVF